MVAAWLAKTAEWPVDAAAVEAAAGAEWRAQQDAIRGRLEALRRDAASLLATFTPDVIDAMDLDAVLLRRCTPTSPCSPAPGSLVREILRGGVHPDDIESVLRRSIARAALTERLSATALAGFDGVVRDRAHGADELRRDMVAELPTKIAAERSFSPDRLVGKVGELNRELSRKRGGQKIRELFANYGPIIGELTPRLMMSPHSVARFLPASALDIDIVVFDEASQIKVAEAISAMGRATSTVVVGDSQQMPPSIIGAVGGATDDDDVPVTAGIPSDMESVLSEAVESNLPRRGSPGTTAAGTNPSSRSRTSSTTRAGWGASRGRPEPRPTSA